MFEILDVPWFFYLRVQTGTNLIKSTRRSGDTGAVCTGEDEA